MYGTLHPGVITGDIQGQDAVCHLDPNVVLPVPPTTRLQQHLQTIQLDTRRAHCGSVRPLLSHSRYATYISGSSVMSYT
jgi:hypothetical protein